MHRRCERNWRRSMKTSGIIAAAALILLNPVAEAQTLKTVQANGQVTCGVNEGLPGFSAPDASRQWKGFDTDFCRALASAIFDDPSKVAFMPVTSDERLAALQSKKVDVLSRNTTWTLGREVGSAIV